MGSMESIGSSMGKHGKAWESMGKHGIYAN